MVIESRFGAHLAKLMEDRALTHGPELTDALLDEIARMRELSKLILTSLAKGNLEIARKAADQQLSGPPT